MDGPVDIDAIAEALRVDGVVVDRVMGSGEAQDSHDRIAALVRETPFPVYVALVERPEGLPAGRSVDLDAFAQLLSRRLGDGLYVLGTDGGPQEVTSFGLGADTTLVSLTAYANKDVLEEGIEAASGGEVTVLPQVVQAEDLAREAEEVVAAASTEPEQSGVYPPTLTAAEAEPFVERAVDLEEAADWRPDVGRYVEVRSASTGLSALVGTLVAMVVALLVGQSVRGWPRRGAPAPTPVRRGRGSPPAPTRPREDDLAVARAQARELADALATSLADLDWSRARQPDLASRALTARDALEPLLASDDLADLVGAQVVARRGARDLSRARSGGGEPLRTCFFDPRHPAATASLGWRLGDGEVEVPTCRRCAARVADGETPDHVRVRSRRGAEQAYWERDDVWARTGFGALSDDLAADVLRERGGER